MKVQFNDDKACPLTQRETDQSTTWGKYIDLKKTPERAAEMPEARDWPALGKFVKDINECEAFRTTGCTSARLKWKKWDEWPFVDVAFCDPDLQLSSMARHELMCALEGLNNAPVSTELVLEIRLTSADFPDGTKVESLRLSFIGSREQAEGAFGPIIQLLAKQHAGEYLARHADDIEHAKLYLAQIRRFQSRLRIAALMLLVMVVALGWIVYRWIF